MPELKMFPSSVLLSLPVDNIKKTGSRGAIRCFRGFLWGIFFEALVIIVIAITWVLWHLLRRFIS